MLAATIDVEQIDEVFPPVTEALQIRGNFFAAGELAIVRVNLIFHPSKIFDGFAFARIESFNVLFALRFFEFILALFLASLNVTTIERARRNGHQVQSFRAEPEQERRDVPKKGRRHGEPSHAPEIDRKSTRLNSSHIPLSRMP